MSENINNGQRPFILFAFCEVDRFGNNLDKDAHSLMVKEQFISLTKQQCWGILHWFVVKIFTVLTESLKPCLCSMFETSRNIPSSETLCMTTTINRGHQKIFFLILRYGAFLIAHSSGFLQQMACVLSL